ncbi:MAG: response regulator [Elusimicrobia bacterium]|nr:response regulator [Candidatus Liberimonas magnetica]
MKKKIAIVDDDNNFLEELSSLLSGNGYDVYAYSNGSDALREIPRVMPDIILLDLKMDKVSGFQVAYKLRNIQKARDIPVIPMTGYYTQDEYGLIMKICGLKNCKLKPFDPGKLMQEISETIKNTKSKLFEAGGDLK